jgi:hypothetical protein
MQTSKNSKLWIGSWEKTSKPSVNVMFLPQLEGPICQHTKLPADNDLSNDSS